MNQYIFSSLIIAVLSGCATTPEAKLRQAYKRAEKTPVSELPALYVELEREGKITSSTREFWTDAWNSNREKERKELLASQKEQQRLEEQRRRWWASLTPSQRLDLEMRERELQQQQAAMAFQSEQESRAYRQAAALNFSHSLQRQAEVDAYNARTRALQRPVNLNVNGNMNHNITGRIDVYGH